MAVRSPTAVNWGAAFLVGEFFLSIVKWIGQAYAFWLFALFCAAGLVWVYLAVPETRCRSLEEIETSWRAGLGDAQVATVMAIARNSGLPLARDLRRFPYSPNALRCDIRLV